MTRLHIISTTVLIATDPLNSDTQLRQAKDGFYMTSLLTGNHFVAGSELTSRVELHWAGFKRNQPYYNADHSNPETRPSSALKFLSNASK